MRLIKGKVSSHTYKGVVEDFDHLGRTFLEVTDNPLTQDTIEYKREHRSMVCADMVISMMVMKDVGKRLGKFRHQPATVYQAQCVANLEVVVEEGLGIVDVEVIAYNDVMPLAVLLPKTHHVVCHGFAFRAESAEPRCAVVAADIANLFHLYLVERPLLQ